MGLLFPKMIMRKKPITVGGSTIGNKKIVSNSTLYLHEERANARPIIVPKIVTIMVAHAATRIDRKIGEKIASKLMAIIIGL